MTNRSSKYDKETVKQAARGRWLEILSTTCGLSPEQLDPQTHQPCPRCSGKDRFRALDDVAETGALFCNQCHNKKNGDGFAAIQWLCGCNFSTAIALVGEHLGVEPKKTAPRRAKRPATSAKSLSKLPPSRLHEAYTLLIEKLDLRTLHGANLIHRGLTKEEIERRQYRSMPSGANRTKIAAELAEALGDDFAEVPGFGHEDDKPKLFGTAGMMIPNRNAQGQIVAITIRTDRQTESKKYTALSSSKHDGPSPGSPPHVPLGVTGPVDTVRLIEGHLKADVVFVLGGMPTISCGGVNMYRRGIDPAKQLGATTIRLAIDADARTKEEVARSLLGAVRTVQAEGIAIELEVWPIEDGKGLDDVLKGGKKPTVLAGEEAIAAAVEIAKAAGVDPDAVSVAGSELIDRLRSKLEEESIPALFQDKELLQAIAGTAVSDPPLFAALRATAREFGVSMQDFKDAIKRYVRAAADECEPEFVRDETGGFFETNGCICRTKNLYNTAPHTIALCNFTARIIDETVRDDGSSPRYFFGIVGKMDNGRPLSRVEVSADKFDKMEWVGNAWGSDPNIWPGEQRAVPAAIRAFSRSDQEGNPQPKVSRTIYEHTGWRQINGRWAYLHAGGIITGDVNPVDKNVSVDLSPPLSDYRLPDPPTGAELTAAVRTSLGVLLVAPPRVTYPLLAATYRAVLGSCDFGVSLAGSTGLGKSELTALSQQHFGAGLDARHLPGSWTSTVNSTERLAFLAKDAILTVDDYAPSGSPNEVQKLRQMAERLFRSQGNNAGRGRMRADGRLQLPTPPRGLILSTGEDVAGGQSVRARQLIVEISPGDVQFSLLTGRQQNAASGKLAAAMAGYVAWLAPRYDGVRQRLKDDVAILRNEVSSHGQHARTPGIVADLTFGFRLFLKFAESIGAITAEERARLRHECWIALLAAAEAQGAHQVASDPAMQFMRLLASGLGTCRFHLADIESDGPPEYPRVWGWRTELVGRGPAATEEWRPRGSRVGWIEGQYVYLDPDAVYAEMQRFAGEQGKSIPVTDHTLWKTLDGKGWLAAKEEGRDTRTIRKTIHGKRRPVLMLFSERVSSGTDSLPKLPTEQQTSDDATTYGGQFDEFHLTTTDLECCETDQESSADATESPPIADHGSNGHEDGYCPIGQVNGRNGQAANVELTTNGTAITDESDEMVSLGSENPHLEDGWEGKYFQQEDWTAE